MFNLPSCKGCNHTHTPDISIDRLAYWPLSSHSSFLQDAMLREFQEEIARLKAELAAAGSGGGTLDSSSNNNAGDVGSSAAMSGAAAAALSEEEVARMRQQLEDELRAEYSSGGGAELDSATLEQVGVTVSMPAFPTCWGMSAHVQMAQAGYFARAAFAVQLTVYCCVGMCTQIRQEVEVQLASQLRQVEAERQRAKREATKLGQQVQQQVAHK